MSEDRRVRTVIIFQQQRMYMHHQKSLDSPIYYDFAAVLNLIFGLPLLGKECP